MRIRHLLPASTLALLTVSSWAQSGPVSDPTGSIWLGEQLAAARRAASPETSTQVQRPVAHRVAATKDDALKLAQPKAADPNRRGLTT